MICSNSLEPAPPCCTFVPLSGRIWAGPGSDALGVDRDVSGCVHASYAALGHIHLAALTLPHAGLFHVSVAVTPPGYYTSGSQTLLCSNGTYRADWKPNAGPCLSCGDGVQTDTTDRVTVYSILNNSVSYVFVTSSSDDCCKCAFASAPS